MNANSKKVIAIVGPTASGKTGIGVRLAKEFDGEIISADSRQIYKGLDIGTGKDLKEYDGVKYHLIDIAEPGQEFSLFKYLDLARVAIEDIFSRGKLPIIVGGTGLYIQGLVEGFKLTPAVIPAKAGIQALDSGPPASVRNDKYSREVLSNLTIEQLNNILREIDPERYEKVDQKNRHRLIRAIELAQEGLVPVKEKPDFEVLQIGIEISRAELHQRIDKRVDERFQAGMLEETQKLLGRGVDINWLLSLGLEYKVMTEFLQKMARLLNCSIAEIPPLHPSFPKRGMCEINNATMQQFNNEFELMKQQLKWKIHQFARRQLTWFRRFPEINWLNDYKKIKRFVKIFLEH